MLFGKKTIQNSKFQCHLLRYVEMKYFSCKCREIYLYLAYFVCVGCVAEKSDPSSHLQPFASNSHFLLGSSVLFYSHYKGEISETVMLWCYLTGCCSDQLLNLVLCQKLHTKRSYVMLVTLEHIVICQLSELALCLIAGKCLLSSKKWIKIRETLT